MWIEPDDVEEAKEVIDQLRHWMFMVAGADRDKAMDARWDEGAKILFEVLDELEAQEEERTRMREGQT